MKCHWSWRPEQHPQCKPCITGNWSQNVRAKHRNKSSLVSDVPMWMQIQDIQLFTFRSQDVYLVTGLVTMSRCSSCSTAPRGSHLPPVCICVVGIFHLTSESVAGVVLLLWQTAPYLVTGLGGVQSSMYARQKPEVNLGRKKEGAQILE